MELKGFTFANFCKLFVLNTLYLRTCFQHAISEAAQALWPVQGLSFPANH
jgi:hypothetical protein